MAPFCPAQTVSTQDSSCAGFGHALRVRVYRPRTRQAAPPVLVYFHPGRFVSGGLDEAEETGRALAGRFGIVVITPAYTLAAQHPFPAAAEDAYAALKWTSANAGRGLWSARRIGLIGLEAGGNLAAVAAMMARDRGGPPVAAQVLFAPMLDPTLSSCSMRAAEAASRACSEAYHSYLPQATDRMHPYAAPSLCSRLDGLPPALILTTETDPLRDEAQHYAGKLIAAGVKTRVTRLAQAGWSPQALDEIGDFLSPLLSPSHRRGNTTSSPS